MPVVHYLPTYVCIYHLMTPEIQQGPDPTRPIQTPNAAITCLGFDGSWHRHPGGQHHTRHNRTPCIIPKVRSATNIVQSPKWMVVGIIPMQGTRKGESSDTAPNRGYPPYPLSLSASSSNSAQTYLWQLRNSLHLHNSTQSLSPENHPFVKPLYAPLPPKNSQCRTVTPATAGSTP